MFGPVTVTVRSCYCYCSVVLLFGPVTVTVRSCYCYCSVLLLRTEEYPVLYSDNFVEHIKKQILNSIHLYRTYIAAVSYPIRFGLVTLHILPFSSLVFWTGCIAGRLFLCPTFIYNHLSHGTSDCQIHCST